MVSWKEEFKQAGIELGFDLLLVGLIICWIAAIVVAILEISLWVVFAFFLLGCVFLFSMFYVARKYGDDDDEEEIEEEKEGKDS